MKTLIFSLIFSTSLLCAQNWTVVGYGATEDEAQHDALENLSQSIKTEIRSEFSKEVSQKSSRVRQTLHSKLSLVSELPLLGSSIDVFKRSDSYEAHASLNKNKALPLYKSELKKDQKLLSELKVELQKKQDSTLRLSLLLRALNILKESYSYNMILSGFNEQVISMPLNEIELLSQLHQVESDITSMELASKIIAKSLILNNESVYIYPPKAPNTKETTPFSSVMLKLLKSQMKTVAEPKNTNFYLRGSYETFDDKMILHYALYDVINRKNIKSKTIFLNKDAYKGIRVKPLNLDFSSLLESAQVVSNKFQVMIKSNKGESSLLYEKGEEIELFIRLNHSGYYYIVGYTQNENHKFSYLLPLNDAEDSDAFIQFVHADMANRWISLGSFTIEPPYGIETLQIFASNHKINNLPAYHYNEENGFYMIEKDITKALSKTRAIMFKKGKKALKSEASLSFTTVEN